MKKIIFLVLTAILLFSPFNNSFASDTSSRLKGRILLQVESHGEAWYVNPSNSQRYFLEKPADAFQIMRELGLGISNKDFNLFNELAPSRLSGKILLKVEDSGKAYYVNPVNLKMYFLGNPTDAFNIMRNLGLGITNENLGMISVSQLSTDWLPFKSSYFTLSFKIPSGFEVKEAQNHILIAKSPYYTVDIGGDNSFLYLIRYDERNTRESILASYKKSLKNWKESQVIIDGSLFLAIKGTDIGGFEGDSAGRIIAVFFDASWLQIMERPANKDQDFDPIAIGNEILATFKFSK